MGATQIFTSSEFEAFHREVIEALNAIGNPKLGAAIQKDRGSDLEHLGVRFPALRNRVKQGFSFSTFADDHALEIWDHLWRTSPYGDVLFAAIEHYLPIMRKRNVPELWPEAKHWIDRVDNWCHCDGLSNVYSWILARKFDEVYPQIEVWNRSENEWRRRASLVSLVHYTGKHAVFLPPEVVLPMVSNCLDDRRQYVQTAMGWVLREMGRVYRDEVAEFLKVNDVRLGSKALGKMRSH